MTVIENKVMKRGKGCGRMAENGVQCELELDYRETLGGSWNAQDKR